MFIFYDPSHCCISGIATLILANWDPLFDDRYVAGPDQIMTGLPSCRDYTLASDILSAVIHCSILSASPWCGKFGPSDRGRDDMACRDSNPGT